MHVFILAGRRSDAGGTHPGRVSDAVFDKLFLGGTVFGSFPISERNGILKVRTVTVIWYVTTTPFCKHYFKGSELHINISSY